jgi:hypothetical protein
VRTEANEMPLGNQRSSESLGRFRVLRRPPGNEIGWRWRWPCYRCAGASGINSKGLDAYGKMFAD